LSTRVCGDIRRWRNKRIRRLARKVSSSNSIRGFIAFLDFRKRALCRNGMEIRLSRSICQRLTGRRRTSHQLDQMRLSTKEEFMIVRVSVSSLADDSSKAPTIRLPDKGTELAVFEVSWNNLDFKLSRLEDLPAASVGEPSDDIRKVLPTQNCIHLCWKVGDPSWSSDRSGGVWVRKSAKVSIIKVWVARFLLVILLLWWWWSLNHSRRVGRRRDMGVSYTILGDSHRRFGSNWVTIIETSKCIKNSGRIIIVEKQTERIVSILEFVSCRRHHGTTVTMGSCKRSLLCFSQMDKKSMKGMRGVSVLGAGAKHMEDRKSYCWIACM
jgi:hypothetical protein